jgi:hypothetical protein
VESLVGAQRAKHLFQDVRTYVMFIGQPRSGTSLLGSILNAHRNVCVAQELNALRYFRRDYSASQVYWLLLERDRTFEKSGRQWTDYDYTVADQWQGRFEKLSVIGDKKASLSSEQLGRDPKLLQKVEDRVQVPVRLVHLVRNPFNVITTFHKKRKRTSLEMAAQMFFGRCETNWRVMQERGSAVKTLRLEDLIAAPHYHLAQLCEFLDLDAHADYIDACASILFPKPRQTKGEIPWPAALVESVSRQIESFPFLHGYCFDDRAVCQLHRNQFEEQHEISRAA